MSFLKKKSKHSHVKPDTKITGPLSENGRMNRKPSSAKGLRKKRKSGDLLPDSMSSAGGAVAGLPAGATDSPGKRQKLGRMNSFRQLGRRASELFINPMVGKASKMIGTNRRQSLPSAVVPLTPPLLSGSFWGVSLQDMYDREVSQLLQSGAPLKLPPGATAIAGASVSTTAAQSDKDDDEDIEEDEFQFACPEDAANAGMPQIFFFLLNWLQNNVVDAGLSNPDVFRECQGLFRKSTSHKHYVEFRNYLERHPQQMKEDVTLCEDPKFVANILKSVIRELPGGLLGAAYDSFLTSCSDRSELRDLVAQLPVVNRRVLMNLCLFLYNFEEHKTVHLMDASNLAKILAPNLKGPKEASPPGSPTPFPRGHSSSSSSSSSAARRKKSNRTKGPAVGPSAASVAAKVQLDAAAEMETMAQPTALMELLIVEFPFIFVGASDDDGEAEPDPVVDPEDRSTETDCTEESPVADDDAADVSFDYKRALEESPASKPTPPSPSPDMVQFLNTAISTIGRTNTGSSSSKKKKKHANHAIPMLIREKDDHFLDLLLEKKHVLCQWDCSESQHRVPVSAFLDVVKRVHELIVLYRDGDKPIFNGKTVTLTDKELAEALDDGTGHVQLPVIVQKNKMYVGRNHTMLSHKIK